jgi:methionine sulfoxide reductase heme-binding subunit
MTNPTPHLFWITSRAAGFTALILASLAVSLGLLMSTKLLKRRGPDLFLTHEILSLATIAAIVVHGVALLGDQYLHPSIADISIPFVSSYKSIWTTLGIVSGWTLILLGLAYYARRWIGAARWRELHRFTALAWLAGVVHALGEGTDAGQLWFLAMLAIVAIPAIALLARRWLWNGGRSPAGARRADTPPRRAAPPRAASPRHGALPGAIAVEPPAHGVVPPRRDRAPRSAGARLSAPREVPAQG